MNEQQNPWQRPPRRWKTLAVSLRIGEHDRIAGQAGELGITLHQLTLRALRAGLPLVIANPQSTGATTCNVTRSFNERQRTERLSLGIATP